MAESSNLPPQSPPTEANQPAPSETPSPASPTSSAPDDSAEKISRRRRGRPTGSKNKPKQPLIITRQLEPAFKTVQFELPLGCDIVEMLEKFARMNRVGLHVLDGSGCVRNLTLQNTSSVPSGILNLVTLSGTFMDPTMMASSSSTATGALMSFHTSGLGPWLRVFATGSTMEVYGGIVSRVQAASNVVVCGLTFKSSEPKHLDPTEYATIPERNGPSSGGGSGGIGGSFGNGLVGGGGSGVSVGGSGVTSAPPGFGAGGGSGGSVGRSGVAQAPPRFGAPTPEQNWGFRPPMENMRPSN